MGGHRHRESGNAVTTTATPIAAAVAEVAGGGGGKRYADTVTDAEIDRARSEPLCGDEGGCGGKLDGRRVRGVGG